MRNGDESIKETCCDLFPGSTNIERGGVRLSGEEGDSIYILFEKKTARLRKEIIKKRNHF